MSSNLAQLATLGIFITRVQPDGFGALHGEELHPVMSAGDGGVTESVGDADGVGRVHQGGDLVGVNPADCHGFGAVAVDGAERGAAED